jgi:phosphoribosyl 1,2-cyclic phosphodiesterase
MSAAHITVLGGRGSIPVSGSEFARYGGNTTCFALVVDGIAVAFVDAGTGLIDSAAHGLQLAPSVGVFLTHYHWDHTQGLSMMDEMWSGACDICVWGPKDPADILERAISPPLFPVSIRDVPSIRFASSDGPVEIGGLVITPFAVNHPQGAFGYRIDGPERAVAIVTDHEAGTDLDAGVLEAISGADVLIHDAQYLPQESEAHVGWGHSTHEDATKAALLAGVSELILTSHDPRRTDSAIDEMVADACETFPNTDAVWPGMEVSL